MATTGAASWVSGPCRKVSWLKLLLQAYPDLMPQGLDRLSLMTVWTKQGRASEEEVGGGNPSSRRAQRLPLSLPRLSLFFFFSSLLHVRLSLAYERAHARDCPMPDTVKKQTRSLRRSALSRCP